MNVSPEDSELYYPVEADWRRINCGLLTPGYIREQLKSSGLKPNRAPLEDVINLCLRYVAPTIFDTEAHDPVNHITPSDKIESDRYKVEGNVLFKAKEYAQSIIKYTTAIRFNPNNHLLFSNRATARYFLSLYEDAKTDIRECLRIDPSFRKGWIRYGFILQNLGELGAAGVAFKTAWILSKDDIGCDDEPQCRLRYNKFMKFLKMKKKQQTIQFIINFEKEPFDQIVEWDHMVKAMAKRDSDFRDLVHRFKNGTKDLVYDLQHQLQGTPEMQQFEEKKDLKLVVSRSRFRYYKDISPQSLRFDNDSVHFMWSLNCSTFAAFRFSKREWRLSIERESNELSLPLYQTSICGRPCGTQLVAALFQTMTYNNNGGRCIKPRIIKFPWRMHKEFPFVKRVVSPLGIQCYLVSKQESLASCKRYGTDLMGYNHLD